MYHKLKEYLYIGVIIWVNAIKFYIDTGMKVQEWYIDQMVLKQKCLQILIILPYCY